MSDKPVAAMEPQLPRRLAIELLHAAQQAGDRPFDAIVLRPAPDRLPERMLMLDAAMDPGEATTWAIYQYRPGQSAAPAPLEFSRRPLALRLTASLAIKGVLQLHAWRCVDGVVHEVSLRIAD